MFPEPAHEVLEALGVVVAQHRRADDRQPCAEVAVGGGGKRVLEGHDACADCPPQEQEDRDVWKGSLDLAARPDRHHDTQESAHHQADAGAHEGPRAPAGVVRSPAAIVGYCHENNGRAQGDAKQGSRDVPGSALGTLLKPEAPRGVGQLERIEQGDPATEEAVARKPIGKVKSSNEPANTPPQEEEYCNQGEVVLDFLAHGLHVEEQQDKQAETTAHQDPDDLEMIDAMVVDDMPDRLAEDHEAGQGQHRNTNPAVRDQTVQRSLQGRRVLDRQ
mmetsp:Transcript_82433/g.223365  ORF Transcript_82433/g.223365 Transcript_82433/m.223365 type:complete len:275 (+) Transcript_82433:768-1592(+)